MSFTTSLLQRQALQISFTDFSTASLLNTRSIQPSRKIWGFACAIA
jgi:hypothetical protein